MEKRQYSPKRCWENLTSICQGMRLSSAQSFSRVRLFATPWTSVRQNFLFITNSQSLLKLMSIELVMPSYRLILFWSLLFPSSIFPSIRVVSNEAAVHIRWPKYWIFSFGINPSTKYSELIAFEMDSLDLPAVQGNLKSLLQHQSSKASNLQCSDFLIVQLSHPYMTTGKTTDLTRWSFVGKIMYFLYNMLSGLVKSFPKEQESFNFMAAVTICTDSGAQNVVCHCVPIYLPWSDGTGCHDLSLLNVELQATFSLSSFTFIKGLFSSSLSAIGVLSSAYLRLLIFLQSLLIPVCVSSSPAFLMMWLELCKQGL